MGKRSELDEALKARIMLLDDNKEIDTSYATKALDTHNIKDMVQAIIEARKITTEEGKIWLEKLEDYYSNYYDTDLEEIIADVENNYDFLIRKALESKKIENMYLILSKLKDLDNPIYTYWYSRIDTEFEKKVGFKYEERSDVLKTVESQVSSAKNSNNLAKLLITLELLKQLIDFNELPKLTPLYEKWYKELDDILKVNTEADFEEITELKDNSLANIDGDIFIIINELISKKNSENKEQTQNYKDYVLDTTDCITLDDMYLKYSKEIENDYNINYSKITRLMQSVDSQLDVSDLDEKELELAKNLRRAKYIFEQDRVEYNTEDDINEDEYREIRSKSTEFNELLNQEVNFEDSKEVYKFLRSLIPYVDIHPLTITDNKNVDKYIIELLNGHGYTKDNVVVSDINSFYKNMVSKLINELDTYHFFVSGYGNVVLENERLTSSKVKEIASLNYYKELYYETGRRIEHIDNKLSNMGDLIAQTIAEYNDKNKQLEEEIKKIDDKINNIHDLTITSTIFKTEDTEAYDAYNLASSNPNKDTLTDMFTAISKLHDRTYKDKMLVCGYELLDKLKEAEKITKKDYNSIERANKLTYVKRRSINNILDEKQDVEDDIEEFALRKDKALEEIEETQKTLKNMKSRYEEILENTKITVNEVAQSLSDKGYVDKTKEFKEIVFDDDKDSLLDKFKNLFNRNKKNNKKATMISQENETLKNTQTVVRIKPIKKKLYEKVNSEVVKNKISEGIKEAKDELKKEPLTYIAIAFMTVGIGVMVPEAVALADEISTSNVTIEKPVDVDSEISLKELNISDIEIPFIDQEMDQDIDLLKK